jgi:hypothetical protein
MAEKKDKFSWGKGDVEIIMPNGKKMQPKKTSKPKTQPKKK